MSELIINSLESVWKLPLKKWKLSKKRFGLHIKRVAVFIFGLIHRTYIPYLVIGLYNRLTNQIDSLFLCYAGSKKYANNYCYSFTRKTLLWWPTPIAIFKQGDKWGVALATPMEEAEFLNPKNREPLKKLLKRMNFIAKLLGVKKISYAGILPSYLTKTQLIPKSNSSQKVANVVCKSIETVILKHFQTSPHVILVGGNGVIGAEIQLQLAQLKIKFEILDIAGEGYKNIPDHLKNQPTLIVDVSRKGVMDSYFHELWRDVVIINETFPEPNPSTIKKINNKGIPLYHISGVEGFMYPQLPAGYRNAIPCCAIHSVGMDCKPVIKRLNYEQVYI